LLIARSLTTVNNLGMVKNFCLETTLFQADLELLSSNNPSSALPVTDKGEPHCSECTLKKKKSVLSISGGYWFSFLIEHWDYLRG
jgi:hypothetical protein